MLLPACSMVYLITLLCGGHLTAPPCIRSLPLLIWSLVHLPIILHMMEMHDTVEVSRGVGCETNMYLFPIVVDFVICNPTGLQLGTELTHFEKSFRHANRRI